MAESTPCFVAWCVLPRYHRGRCQRPAPRRSLFVPLHERAARQSARALRRQFDENFARAMEQLGAES